jgi:protein O-mannosyl-transferase
MTSVAIAPVQIKPVWTIAKRYKQAAGLSLVLLVATVALYYPVIHHPFTNVDDQGYVYENLHVQDGLTWNTFTWAMRTFDDSNWHPLTWFSHALDCQLFGIDPAGHHAMNMAWHAVDAVLLFWILLLATGFVGRSFMVAALFAVHPINVESVAWMAERKTILSTFFFLLALGAYRWYARRPDNARYFTVAALFVLGLMAKPQIITLPFVFLLWDYWPLRRMFADSPSSSGDETPGAAFPSRTFHELIREKVPLFVICLASALITMKAQHVGRPGEWPYSGWIRIGNAIVAYVRYLGKALWPSNLAIMYLHPGNNLGFWKVATAALLLLLIAGAAWKTISLSSGRMVLVLRDAGPNHRTDASRTPGISGSVRIPVLPRTVHYRLLGCCGLGPRKAFATGRSTPGKRRSAADAQRRGAAPDRLLVRQSHDVEPRSAGHRQQLGCP